MNKIIPGLWRNFGTNKAMWIAWCLQKNHLVKYPCVRSLYFPSVTKTISLKHPVHRFCSTSSDGHSLDSEHANDHDNQSSATTQEFGSAADKRDQPLILDSDYFNNLKSVVPITMEGNKTASEKLANLQQHEQKALEMIRMEYELFKCVDYKIPVQLTDKNWVDLLGFHTEKQRLKYLRSIYASDMYRKHKSVLRKLLEAEAASHSNDGANSSLMDKTKKDTDHGTDSERLARISHIINLRERNIIRGRYKLNHRRKSQLSEACPHHLVLDLNVSKKHPLSIINYVIERNYSFDEAFHLTVCNISEQDYLELQKKELENNSASSSALTDGVRFTKKPFYEIFNPKDICFLTEKTNHVAVPSFSPNTVYVISNRSKIDIQRDVHFANFRIMKLPVVGIVNDIMQQNRHQSPHSKDLSKPLSLSLTDYVTVLKLLRRGHSWQSIAQSLDRFHHLLQTRLDLE